MEVSFFFFLSLLVELSVDLSAEESRIDDREKRKVETRPDQNRTRLKMISSRRVAPHRTVLHERRSEAKPREGGIRSQTCQGKAMTRQCVLCCDSVRFDSGSIYRVCGNSKQLGLERDGTSRRGSVDS